MHSLRNQLIGALSLPCLAPSFILTVVPTFAHDVGLAVAMAIGVLALPALPFAIRRAQRHATRVFLVTLAAATLIFNFTNALDALNRAHAAALDTNATITELNARRNAIPAHALATKAAVDAAQKARDDECKTGYATKCRAREDELRTAQRDYAATTATATVEAALDRAKAAQTALVPIEATSQRTADQIADLTTIQAATVAKHRPVFKAAIIEMLSGIVPFCPGPGIRRASRHP